jgi:uncharacterized membrane protein YbhN (UPF0104 family)
VTSALGSLNAAVDRLADLDARWLGIALGLQLANLAFRAVAWGNVLRAAYPSTRIRLVDVGAAYAAGVALNAYTPARAGEALKVALLRLRVPGSSVATIAASSSVILVFDALMGGTLLVGVWALGVVPAVPGPSLRTALAVAALGLVAAAVLRFSPRLRAHLRRGGAILATPGAYLRRVALAQLGAWACRIGVAFSLLAAFGLPATLPFAAVVVVAGGLSTLVPATPGGAGTQQLLVVYALDKAASAASALSFSIGMQLGITVVNTLVGIAGLALLLGTLRPAAIRAALRDPASARA